MGVTRCCAISGRCSTTAASTWSSLAMITSTSGSHRRTRGVVPILNAGSGRSWLARAGRDLDDSLRRSAQNSELRANDSIGVLTLTLRPENYTWRFVSVPGLPLADSGSASCN